MGRARGQATHLATRDRFAEVFGTLRGTQRIDWTAKVPNTATLAYVQRLKSEAVQGEFSEALRELELAGEDAIQNVPLLAELEESVVRGLGSFGRLYSGDRRTLHSDLGLVGVVPQTEPSPAHLDSVVRRKLREQLEKGTLAGAEYKLRNHSRACHREAFASGLAREALLSPAQTVQEVLGSDTDRIIQELPGGPQKGRNAWAGTLLKKGNWKVLFLQALLREDRRNEFAESLEIALHQSANGLVQTD